MHGVARGPDAQAERVATASLARHLDHGAAVTDEPFASPDSIIRRIWGDMDVIMLVFAGSAAEFGLNRAVDWLFVTGDLPRDPIGRFFSTASYARRIAFGSRRDAERAFAMIRGAHSGVERQRGGRIPDW